MPENNSEPRDGLEAWRLVASFAKQATAAIEEGEPDVALSDLDDLLFIAAFIVEQLEKRRKVSTDASE